MQTALIAAISGIAKNNPDVPQTRSQKRQPISTVVAFKSIDWPITHGTMM